MCHPQFNSLLGWVCWDFIGTEGLGLRLGFDGNDYSQVLELCEEFVPGEVPEYFFDKNPENFPAILDMYRGVKHVILDSEILIGPF